MLIISNFKNTTPRGRQWITQISVDTSDVRKGETQESALYRQLRANAMQLEYERTQLL